MLSGGNQTYGNSLERFLTPYQHSRLPLINQNCFLLLQEFLAIEDEEMREELLNRMNQAVTSLYFPPFTPIQHEMYKVGYVWQCCYINDNP